MNHHELRIEKDMLQGNIARLSLSDDIEELERMRTWAHKRIDIIADTKIQELLSKSAE